MNENILYFEGTEFMALNNGIQKYSEKLILT
jgi:hypothetical protein